MKIYILKIYESNEGSYVVGPFSSVENVKKYIDEHPLKEECLRYDYDEFEVDDQNAEIRYF